MDEKEIQDLIEKSRALIEENSDLLKRQEEVFAEVKQAMAEQMGCSIWDLERMLERDLPIEERQAYEQQAKQLISELAPDSQDLLTQSSSAATGHGGMPVPGAPRPRRRMV